MTRIYTVEEVDQDGVVEFQLGRDATFTLKSVPLSKLSYFTVQDWIDGEGCVNYMRRLVNAYRKGGRKIPPVVLRRNGDMYDILDGGHRTSAAAHAGLKEIPAYVLREEKRMNGDEDRRRRERRARETGSAADAFRAAVAAERVDGQARRLDRWVEYALWRMGEVVTPGDPMKFQRDPSITMYEDELPAFSKAHVARLVARSRGGNVAVSGGQWGIDPIGGWGYTRVIVGAYSRERDGQVCLALKATPAVGGNRAFYRDLFPRLVGDDVFASAVSLDRYEEDAVDTDDVRVYDNGGETADRYTILLRGEVQEEPFDLTIGANAHPDHPQGIWMHVESSFDPDEPGHVGQELVPWTRLVSPGLFHTLWDYRGHAALKVPNEIAHRWVELVLGGYFS